MAAKAVAAVVQAARQYTQYHLRRSPFQYGAAPTTIELERRLTSALEVHRPVLSTGGVLSMPANAKLVFEGSAGVNALTLGRPTPSEVSSLLAASSPAAFGRGGELVLDSTYRHAAALEPSAFNFLGWNVEHAAKDVAQQVTRVLFPTATNVRAVLYKLNVYEAGGMFKSHIDTPRPSDRPREHMEGSLVITLPVPHEGGQLKVGGPMQTPGGPELSKSGDVQLGPPVVYDTGRELAEALAQRDEPSLPFHWVAFYSDVPHEVLPVTSGHRVTLTFNLYTVSETEEEDVTYDLEVATVEMARREAEKEKKEKGGNGREGASTAIGPSTVSGGPIETALRELLSHTLVLPLGGTLAVYTRHLYPFTHPQFIPKVFPRVLKGTDAMLLRAVEGMGLAARLLPVLDEEWEDDEFDVDDDGNDDDDDDDGADADDKGKVKIADATTGDAVMAKAKQWSRDVVENATYELKRSQDPAVLGNTDMVGEFVTKMALPGGWHHQDLTYEDATERGAAYVLTKHLAEEMERLAPPVVEVIVKGSADLKHVTYMAFGNEDPFLHYMYSAAALVVKLPAWDRGVRRQLTKVWTGPVPAGDSA